MKLIMYSDMCMRGTRAGAVERWRYKDDREVAVPFLNSGYTIWRMVEVCENRVLWCMAPPSLAHLMQVVTEC
jgi:hypothetical protein